MWNMFNGLCMVVAKCKLTFGLCIFGRFSFFIADLEVWIQQLLLGNITESLRKPIYVSKERLPSLFAVFQASVSEVQMFLLQLLNTI